METKVRQLLCVTQKKIKSEKNASIEYLMEEFCWEYFRGKISTRFFSSIENSLNLVEHDLRKFSFENDLNIGQFAVIL